MIKKQEETFFSKNKGERKKFLQSYIEKYQKRLEEYLQRFTLEGADIQLHWDIPDFISFKFINKPRAKESMLMRFPFLKSATFNVEPQLKPKENYLVTIIDFETLINSQLNVEYVMNVALTLQKVISSNIVGASLILKGRLPYGLLKWLRGESPLKPSPIPNVEILYAIPIKDDKEAKEYWFTLKVGTAYRLRKNNKSLVEAKDIHSKWDSIRSYTIIDHYITNVQQANYLLFIRDFWLAFDKIDKPEKDIPDFKILKSTSGVSDSEKKIKIKEKIESYKKSLTEEINDQKKPTHVREKCKGILDDINERKDDKLVNEIFQRVKFIADNVDNSVGLHYMNWNHIICDTVRKKNYNKQSR